jgi:hypothetical protein
VAFSLRIFCNFDDRIFQRDGGLVRRNEIRLLNPVFTLGKWDPFGHGVVPFSGGKGQVSSIDSDRIPSNNPKKTISGQRRLARTIFILFEVVVQRESAGFLLCLKFLTSLKGVR